MGTFQTTDLYLVAYLRCLNYSISLELEDSRTGRVLFYVQDTDQRKIDVNKFFDGTAQISARNYASAIKNFKAQIANIR